MYFLKSISDDVRFAQLEFRKHTKAKRLVLGSFLACMAALLQASRWFFTRDRVFYQPICHFTHTDWCHVFLQMGVMSYFLTILLLFILFPSELVVFPFTTGVVRDWYRRSFFLFQQESKHYFYWCHFLKLRNYESAICFPLSRSWSGRIRFLFIPYSRKYFFIFLPLYLVMG